MTDDNRTTERSAVDLLVQECERAWAVGEFPELRSCLERAIIVMKAQENILRKRPPPADAGKPVVFTAEELEDLRDSPLALQAAIDHHHVQEAEGDAMGYDVKYHEVRRKELEALRDATLEKIGEPTGDVRWTSKPYSSPEPSKSRNTPAEDACLDLFNDFESEELKGSAHSIRFAWEVGRQLY